MKELHAVSIIVNKRHIQTCENENTVDSEQVWNETLEVYDMTEALMEEK